MADVERAVVGTLEKQFADVIAPLKDFLVPKKFGLQYMQKLTRRQKPVIYNSPTQVHHYDFITLFSLAQLVLSLLQISYVAISIELTEMDTGCS